MENLEKMGGKTKEEIEEILRTKMGGAERVILELHYGLNGNPECTFEKIAKELNISMEKAREIEVKAIKLLIQRKDK